MVRRKLDKFDFKVNGWGNVIRFYMSDIPVLEHVRIDTYFACMMFTTRDTKGHTHVCLIGYDNLSRLTDFSLSGILDIGNVIINTKIESIACIQPELSKVIWRKCMTLSSKVNYEGHVIYSNIYNP